MPKVQQITVRARRSLSANYCTREVEFEAVVELSDGDNPAEVARKYSRHLQQMCDQELGDAASPHAFQSHH